MRVQQFRIVPLVLTVLACTQAVYSQKRPSPAQTTVANGVLTGLSGKPLAGARLFLAEVIEDQDVLYSRLKLVASGGEAVTDANGRFSFKGFPPGVYAIVYVPAGGSSVFPTQISIKSLLAVTESTMPLLKGVEIAKSPKDRPWGKQWVLLKGHTFLSEGANMKIWNATARRVPQGPYIEIRKGIIWHERLDDKSEIKFQAWSF